MSAVVKSLYPDQFEENSTDSSEVRIFSPSESKTAISSSTFHSYIEPEKSESSESKQEFVFDDLVERMSATWGWEKQQIADEVIQRIASSKDKTSKALWAGHLILQSKGDNCIYDFAGILSRLGPAITRDCVFQALQQSHREQYTDDYWFAAVRALGFLCQRGHTDEFRSLIVMVSRNLSNIAMREAAVYALADIQDESAAARLNQMAEKDPSPIIREAAQESLEEIEAG